MAHLLPRCPTIKEHAGTFTELLYGDYHPSDFPFVQLILLCYVVPLIEKL